MNRKSYFLTSVLVLLMALAMNQSAFGIFTSAASNTGNVFSASSVFPSPSVIFSPSPSASSSATPIPSSSPVPQNHLVINEVYYFVDSAHGGINIVISGNGAGSSNTVNISGENNCLINQSNNSNVTTVIDNSAQSGGNKANGNTGGNAGTVSGDATSSAAVVTTGNSNNSQGCNSNGNGQNYEWIELYNPTNAEISLKDMTLTDNSGVAVKIPGNFKLGAGKFALLSKSNATWSFWSVPAGVLKIPLGKQIGNGLDDGGDRLVLKNKNGDILDQLSWGTDTGIFNLIGVDQGHTLERNPDGTDTDAPADFTDRFPPAPGY